ncbi:hypothetical protein NH340_JMT05646 [Sarcoptes scabiei]|nr:hypothetical protein NH340_JMT05646 [Sarcoptes scabiei]
MDEISMDDLDILTIEMMERVKSYKKYLDQVLNDCPERDSNFVQSENFDKEISDCLGDDDESTNENAINHDYVEKTNFVESFKDSDAEIPESNMVRFKRSIQNLLNVHDSLNQYDEEKQCRSTLQNRLHNLAEKYRSEDDANVIASNRPEIDMNKSLEEIRAATNEDKSSLRERLDAIAKLYYPVKQESSSHLKSTVKSETPKTVSNKSTIIESNHLNHPKSEKQASVADLKKKFESSEDEMNKIVEREAAPELLSLKEKKRLFEKAISDENDAVHKQYKKNFVITPKIQSNEKPEFVSQDTRIDSESENRNIIQKDPIKPSENVSLNTHESMEEMSDSSLRDENDDKFHMSNSFDADRNDIDETESICRFEPMDFSDDRGSVELTFTAIDDAMHYKADSLNEIQNESEPLLHRSSTRFDLNNGPSTANAKLFNEDCIFDELDSENIEPCPNEQRPPFKTISFYRREQKSRQTNDSIEKDAIKSDHTRTNGLQNDSKLTKLLEEKRNIYRKDCESQIIALKEEIFEHNRVLSQSSTALNLSLSMPKLCYSECRVEAERLLLIANEKRNACLNELNRLKSIINDPEKISKELIQSTKGVLHLKNIKIPFLNHFLMARAKGKALDVNYFICLICCGPKVFVSNLINILDDPSNEFLDFDLGITVENLDENFTVIVKLFNLELGSKEFHNAKSKLTPFTSFRRKLVPNMMKKSSAADPDLAVFKPVGRSIDLNRPMVISSFKMVGYFTLCLKNVKSLSNKFYRLNSECFRSIIDNYFITNMMLKASFYSHTFQGYFDLQEQSTLFWNLRWFSLCKDNLFYWRFEEHKSKSALGRINLKNCINPEVAFLRADQRHLCMRPNTFVLAIIEPSSTQNDSNRSKLRSQL